MVIDTATAAMNLTVLRILSTPLACSLSSARNRRKTHPQCLVAWVRPATGHSGPVFGDVIGRGAPARKSGERRRTAAAGLGSEFAGPADGIDMKNDPLGASFDQGSAGGR